MTNTYINQIWPEWQIDKQIGRGSYGEVYRAFRQTAGQTEYAAIKLISIPQDEYSWDTLRAEGMNEGSMRTFYENMTKDLLNEVCMMEPFRDADNIVTIRDYASAAKPDGSGWVILIRMELLTPLNTHICTVSMTEDDIIRLGTDISEALTLCADRNVLHRDIKPENIFVNAEGIYKLGDFGISRKMDDLTGSLSQRGTLNYMAPEVTWSNHYDSRADIYSLGLVLYRQANGGRLPFLAEKQLQSPQDRRNALEKRLTGEPLPAPAFVSEELSAVILKACAYEPADRYQSAAEFKAALCALRAEKAAAAAVSAEAGARKKKYFRLLLPLLLLLLLLLVRCGKENGSGISTAASSDADTTAPGSTEIYSTEAPAESSELPSSSAAKETTAAESSAESDAAESSAYETAIVQTAAEETISAETTAAESTSAETATARTREAAESTTASTTAAQPASKAESAATAAHTHSFGDYIYYDDCSSGGFRVRSCSVCGYEEKTYFEPGYHEMTPWVITQELTCSHLGIHERHCLKCSYAEEETFGPLREHTPVVDEGYYYGCDVDCLTEGSHCAVCNEVLVSQMRIPAGRHYYVNGVCTLCGAQQFPGESADLESKDFTLNPDGKSYTLTGWSGKTDGTTVIKIPASYSGLPVTSIGSYAFKGKVASTLEIPASVTSLGDHALSALQLSGNLTIPGTVKNIGSFAFDNFTPNSQLTLSEGIQSIGAHAFTGFGTYKGSPSIVLPNSLITLGDYAFFNTDVVRVTFGNRIKNVGKALFQSNSHDISITPLSGTYFNAQGNVLVRKSDSCLVAGGCGEVVSITMTKVIAPEALSGLRLKRLYIPGSVTSIGNNAFAFNSELTTLELPSSLTHIGSGVLTGCPIKSVTFKGSVAQWNSVSRSGWLNGSEASEVTIVCTDGSVKEMS